MSAESPATSLTLLDQLGAGDGAAWRRLFALYAPLMRRWLRPRGLQDADIDDVTQASLAVVVRKLPGFQHNGRQGAFRAWLRSIVGNVLSDHLRSQRRAGADALLADLADPHSELNRLWDADHDRHVLAGLLRLAEAEFAPATWAAFARTALADQPIPEVAADLGLSANAVRIARCRVLAHLRREAGGFALDG